MFSRLQCLFFIFSALFLYLALQPLNSFAQENACQIEITTLAPEPQISDILSEVKFRYLIKHHESCQIHSILTAKEPVVCQKPHIEIRPTGLTTQLLSVVDVQCVYRRPGHFFLAPVYFEVQSAQTGKPTVLHPQMPHVTIRESTNSADINTQFHDFLIYLPWKQKPVALWILFIGVAIIICGLFFVEYSRLMKNRKAEVEDVEVLTPIQEFNSEIALLVDVTPMTLDEYKVYHDRLSNAIRQYIANRFSLDILNMTTTQLIEKLKKEGFPSGLYKKAERLLNASDYVKFALDAPSQADNLLMLRDMGTLAEELETLACQREQSLTATESPAPEQKVNQETTQVSEPDQ